MDFQVPELIDQRYRVKENIGSGAMARVYSAEDTRLGRHVALKILRPEHASDGVFRARFQREAESVASLNHASIVAVYDTGSFTYRDGDRELQIPYMVMELLEGKSLRQLLSEQGALSTADAISYGVQILDALQYSSEAGIIHRDIKPANVMILPQTEEDLAQGRPGQVRVMDFGIARALNESGEALTKANTVMGTARYISPEQARGETVDTRSDLYSAACLIYEMLTGSAPFDAASNVDLAAKHLSETPEAPSKRNPEVSVALDPVLLRALAKSRAERYQSADDFRRDLINANQGIAPAPITAATTAIATTAAATTVRRPARGYAPAVNAAQSPVEETGIGGFFASAQDDYSEEELFEYERNAAKAKAKRRRTAWIRFLTGALIALLAATSVGIALYYQNELHKVATHPVPAVQNISKNEAETTMRNSGFTIKYEEEYSDTIAKGNIIKSSPVTGTALEEGKEVTLTVSKGPSKVTIPSDLSGQSEQYVRTALANAGFVAGRTSTVNSPTIPTGMVVSLDPVEGTSVESGSTVNIVLSDGKVTVPSVVGLTKDQAIAALSASTVLLNTNIETVQTSSQTAGTVISQSAAANTQIEQGSTVTIRVAATPAATATAVPVAPTAAATTHSRTTNSGTTSNIPQVTTAPTTSTTTAVATTATAQSTTADQATAATTAATTAAATATKG